ncbi:MAG: NUDIX hydrolase N-terminal domain-containing protein [Luteolibacter sp.]
MHSFDWISLSRELKGIAEAGLRYTENVFDRERYERLHQIAALPMQVAAPDFVWPMEFGYFTPKVDVRAAVVNDEGKLLLVREASNGLWTFPGGWADQNISPSQNAVKETFEESGLVVEALKLIGCFDKETQGHPRQAEHVYRLIFLCKQTGGELTTNHETSGAGFFSKEEVPDLCPHRSGRQYLDLAWAHAADPTLPTTFD